MKYVLRNLAIAFAFPGIALIALSPFTINSEVAIEFVLRGAVWVAVVLLLYWLLRSIFKSRL